MGIIISHTGYKLSKWTHAEIFGYTMFLFTDFSDRLFGTNWIHCWGIVYGKPLTLIEFLKD